MTEFITVLFSASHTDEAKRIGMALIEERLAACVNIQNNVRSIYWWQGKVTEATETIGTVKTRRDLFSAVSEKIKELHSYTTPEIIAIPLMDIEPAYAEWINKETKQL